MARDAQEINMMRVFLGVKLEISSINKIAEKKCLGERAAGEKHKKLIVRPRPTPAYSYMYRYYNTNIQTSDTSFILEGHIVHIFVT